MNYKIEEINSNFVVVETQTEQIVRAFNTRDKARKFMKFLNLGGAFDGWTPTFFLKRLNITNPVV